MSKAASVPTERRWSDLSSKEKDFLATPVGFGRNILKMPLYPKQEAVLNDLAKPNSRVVFRCGNEVGKTSMVGVNAILWHLSMFPAGQVISTAGAWRQVTDQLVPNLRRYSHLFPKWSFKRESISTADGVDRYVGFSTTDDRRSQGYHGTLEAPLLAIIDEAASVPTAVFHAFEERCNPQRLLIMGSPLTAEGQFYDCATRLSKFYAQHKLAQPDCPHISKESIQRKIDKYGEKHPIVLSSVFAEFMELVEGALLSLAEYERCVESPPQASGTDRHVFCDFAAGGDENVLAVRVGNRVWIEKAWVERDTMRAVGEFVAHFTRLKRQIGLQADEISGDADGLGKPMVDAIREAGWPIHEFHGGGAPKYDQDYRNHVTEAWCNGASLIRKREISLPEDPELRGQILSRKSFRHSSGKLALESKDELRKRGVGSPDRADAIFGAMLPSEAWHSTNLIDTTRALRPTKEFAYDPDHCSHDMDVEVDENLIEAIGQHAGY